MIRSLARQKKSGGFVTALMLLSLFLLVVSGGMVHLESEHEHVHYSVDQSHADDHQHIHAPETDDHRIPMLHCGADILSLVSDTVPVHPLRIFCRSGFKNDSLTSSAPLLEPPPPRILL